MQTCNLDPDGNAEKVEVLVLGAGMAGISAARTLEVNGITDFLVLEATDHVGGRMREYDGPKKLSLEMGAHWYMDWIPMTCYTTPSGESGPGVTLTVPEAASLLT